MVHFVQIYIRSLLNRFLYNQSIGNSWFDVASEYRDKVLSSEPKPAGIPFEGDGGYVNGPLENESPSRTKSSFESFLAVLDHKRVRSEHAKVRNDLTITVIRDLFDECPTQ